MPIYCITARIIWRGYLKCAQSEPWQHFTTTIFTLNTDLAIHAIASPQRPRASVMQCSQQDKLDNINITRVSVSHRGKSCPVNQIVIITVFASSSSDCFNSLIISYDQSSSRPMNEILAWQHLFVTTIILSVCCGLRKYSNNTTCCSSESRKTLLMSSSSSQHGQRSSLFPCDLSLTVWSPDSW